LRPAIWCCGEEEEEQQQPQQGLLLLLLLVPFRLSAAGAMCDYYLQ
jgi:hypothetical protein